MRDARDYRLFKKVAHPRVISVSELIVDAKASTVVIRPGPGPFLPNLDVPMMAEFVRNYKDRFGRYPGDWAVMAYDEVYARSRALKSRKR